MPSYKIVNGAQVEVSDTVVSDDATVEDELSNVVIVRNGAELIARARITGSVVVERGGRLLAFEDVTGTVSLQEGSEAEFHAGLGGALHVSRRATALLKPDAVALGSLNVDGTLVNEGTRGRTVNGDGRVDDLPGSTVRQPDAVDGDMEIYYS